VLRDGVSMPIPFGPHSSQLFIYVQAREDARFNRAYVFLRDSAEQGLAGIVEQKIRDFGGITMLQDAHSGPPVKPFIDQVVLIMSLLVLVATVLLQINMLAISLFEAKKEINAMRLFGMTDADIGLFSYVEVVLSGVIASFIIVVIWVSLFRHLVPVEFHHLVHTSLLLGILVTCITLSSVGGLAVFRIVSGLED